MDVGEERVRRSSMQGMPWARSARRPARGPESCGVVLAPRNAGGVQRAGSTPRSVETDGPILVVGGDLPAQRSMRHALEGGGLVVETIASGWHALTFALVRCPSLVILHPSVPALEWEDVLAGLQVAYGADVPIVVVSDDRRILSRARRLWGSATVTEPFAPDDLLDGVYRALGAG